MDAPLIATKLHTPPPRARVVHRPGLVKRLSEGLLEDGGPGNRLTLISAPAGFGKTTLVSEWVAGIGRPVAWLTLDKGDSALDSFLSYMVAALQTVGPKIGAGVLGILRSTESQPLAVESILTALINDLTAVRGGLVLVLDDYHAVDSGPVDDALAFLVDHLPPRVRVVIATREDPRLPLARLRARGRLIELRAADLRFTPDEAADFFNRVMGLNLTAEDIASLEMRTEGWIAGLQLAAVSMQGNRGQDTAAFIRSFTGGHRFVLDYLIEEVLRQQSEGVQDFLLRTSILDRLSGPLCDAVVGAPSGSAQETLEYLDRANLFTVPLDNERRWYRYHHLFGDLLRNRFERTVASSGGAISVQVLHTRASAWYEQSGMDIEAFDHAAAAGDIERAERLVEGKGMPLHFRGGAVRVLNWLESLPAEVLDARPSLWTAYASTLLVTGQAVRVEQKLQAAESALQGGEPDDRNRDLTGRIAAIRATLAIGQGRVDAIIAQSRRALEYLRPDNLAFRTSTAWKLGYAYQLQGNRAAAAQAYTEVISIGEASGNLIFNIAARIGLGSVQEAENRLYEAAESYRSALRLFGDQPLPLACQAHLGLARVFYEWNDLDAAQQSAMESLQLARQAGDDRIIVSQVFLARLILARGDTGGAEELLAEAEGLARRQGFPHRLEEIAAVRVAVLIRQGQVALAAGLASQYDLLPVQARALIAQGDPSAALALLRPLRQQMDAKGWDDERLKVMVLQAIAFHAQGKRDRAIEVLCEALGLAQPGGLIRTFVDEGAPMLSLLGGVAALGIRPDYVSGLVAAFEPHEQSGGGLPARPDKRSGNLDLSHPASVPSLIERLSERELSILQLIAQGLSNRQIGERLFLALSTVKGHNRSIFDKLQVRSRTEAIARARESGLIKY
jgi:LuxR family transcriptional regulator, maltose regulon positive regulatory protein